MKTKKLSLSIIELNTLIKQIDTLLPQTQCGQCSYSGCLPYAQAIAEKKAEINGCPPGGIRTLKALASLLEKNAEPFVAEMSKREKPPMTAFIRESECIGCTKCIQACPVDAILGAAKQLHIILTEECTGCGLCLEPCPVDCIDMLTLKQPHYQPQQARQRYYAKKERLEKKRSQKNEVKDNNQVNEQTAYIHAAIMRAKKKKQLFQITANKLSGS